VDAVESVSDVQWAFKAGPDRWSIGEVAEHLVLAEAGLFATATKSLAAPADDKWTATLSKTDLLKRALPNRTTKVGALCTRCRKTAAISRSCTCSTSQPAGISLTAFSG